MSVCTVALRSWDSYRATLMQRLFPQGRFINGRYLFRGQARCDWPLRASFDRSFPNIGVGQRKAKFEEMLQQFREACEREGVPPTILFSDDLLALGQHHGLPTRLLDWSRSPYVGAFFSFADLVLTLGLSGIDDQREALQEVPPGLGDEELLDELLRMPGPLPVAVWALNQEDPVWADDFGVQIKNVASVVANVRCRNQGGAFTVLNSGHPDLESWILGLPQQETPDRPPLLWRFVLPACEVFGALADLRAMGIDFTRLFPDLQGCALDSKLEALCRDLSG